MKSLNIFIVRCIVSVLFAFVVCKFYYQNLPLIKVMGLAVIMLGLAYLFEYLRKLGKGEGDGS